MILTALLLVIITTEVAMGFAALWSIHRDQGGGRKRDL